ncbi:hypothetical protein L226DRAFT_607194 [Lentinus tigrinus ALCF2SS1-7]|uniref:uncharacterized protein n=1 Tax=Lentinus tigrinus ALCF2SS1-7 TaxID=1328758 RepID=UPI0011660866|nr:hypothetical protein L226DRAFT_607194 [Lentinus tigrinus ALCF2SS1-7]
MEDFLVDQARYFASILAANAQHIEEKRVATEHYSVHPMSVMNHAEILQVAVGDSVTLQKEYPHARNYVVSKTEFSLLQNQLLGLALQDRARLQDTGTNSVLESIRPQFILQVAETLDLIVRDIAQVATESNTDISKLEMCKPWEVAKLVMRLRHLLEYHIRHLEALTRSKLDADNLGAQLQKENESVVAQHTAAQTRVAELEGKLVTLEQELAQVKTAMDAAEARVDMITKESELLQSTHAQCASKLQERDSDIAQLKEAHKKLIQSYEAQAQAANGSEAKVAVKTEELEHIHVERDKLVGDLAELQASYEHFRLQRAEEMEQLVKENTQLHEALQKRVDETNAMEAHSTRLKGTISQLEAHVRAAETQLTNSEIQCDTWKSMVEDLLPRHTAELDAAHAIAIQEREMREAGDALLQNAARKIEDLERKQREQNDEIIKLREAVAQNNIVKSQRLPISPPPSVDKTGSSLVRKRKAAGKTAASWSQDDKGFALNLAAHGSPIPPERAAVLASLPTVVVNLPDGESPEIFTRQSLSNILGGSVQGLVVRCTNSATDLARRYDITEFLCPNMDHNAWSPPGPGQHGYMQVGLGRDRKLFNGEGEYRHVFVGGGKFFLYCGWYHVLRVDPLTKEEWGVLPPKVKTTYSETTFNKENTRECTNKELWRTIKNTQQVLAMYNQGELRAPLVRLQCLKFDMDFYQELVDANGRYFTNKQRPAPPNVAKRRKVADEANEDDDKEEDIPMALVDDKVDEDNPSVPLGSPSAVVPSEEALASSSSGSVLMDTSVPAAPPTPVSMAGAGIVLPPSSPSRQARYDARQQTSGGLIKLRIPGGRSPHSKPGSDEEREVEDGLSSESDDDDLYAD